MLDWLAAPIDPSRAHEVGGLIAWHGRLMVLAWGVLLPLGILFARFGKIMPGQDWPRELDNQTWWRAHLGLQYGGGCALLAGLVVILFHDRAGSTLHGLAGWCVIAVAWLQYLGGWLRGTKGGPTDETLAGDHFDMTPRRRLFEYVHKSVGYAALLLSWTAILTGLWLANAPMWMWIGLCGWWALLAATFAVLQRRGLAVDTYQAIWGPDASLPGNRIKPIGIGVQRAEDDQVGTSVPSGPLK